MQENITKVVNSLSLESMSFNELVKQSGLNPRYVKLSLNILQRKNQISRAPQKSNGLRGRPRVLYSLKNPQKILLKDKPKTELSYSSPKVKENLTLKKINLPSTVGVEVEFKKLQSVCKHEKKGTCRKIKMQKFYPKCSISKCPLLIKTRLVKT